MFQAETAVSEVCNGGADFICDWVYDLTENDTLAEAFGWIVERPLKVVLILVVAYFLNRIVRRAIARGEERMIQDRERKLLERFPELVTIKVMGEGFTWETQDRQDDMAKAHAAWAVAVELMSDPQIALVVLDELNIALKYRYLEVEQVVRDISSRPMHQHVVVTGRGAPPELIDAADTVTEMGVVKHAFKAGIKAQKGVEF